MKNRSILDRLDDLEAKMDRIFPASTKRSRSPSPSETDENRYAVHISRRDCFHEGGHCEGYLEMEKDAIWAFLEKYGRVEKVMVHHSKKWAVAEFRKHVYQEECLKDQDVIRDKNHVWITAKKEKERVRTR